MIAVALFRRKKKKAHSGEDTAEVSAHHEKVAAILDGVDGVDTDDEVEGDNAPDRLNIAQGTQMLGRRNTAVHTGVQRDRRGVYDFSKLDSVIAEMQKEKNKDSDINLDDTLDVSKLSRKERKALEDAMEGSISSYPHLMAMKPSEGYVFYSDYFTVDNHYGCVLAFFHNDSAEDHFAEFWGINEIPSNLDSEVTTVLFNSVARMPENWIDNNLKTVDRLDKLEQNEQRQGGTMQTKRRTAKISRDMMQITSELQNGSSYLSVQQRLLIKAPTLDMLERNIERIRRLYVERFGTLSIAPYPGEQKQELTNLLAPNKVKRGKGFHFTSAEFAGFYNLVTNGLNDPGGEYVGYMLGDVNTSAVLFNVDDYAERVVCADNTISTVPILNRPRVVDMWGSKISQSALLANHRVVHIVLNDAKLDELGPRLDNITSRVDMVSGDINMFEFFGDVSDELSLYSAQVEKITLMAEEAQPSNDHDRSIVRGALSHMLERFYTDAGMWSPNAKENRDRLRLVGLNHKDVPRLHNFYAYLEQEYKALANKGSRDDDQLRATNKLQLLFKALLENNGDLFDQPTSNHIDGVDASRRVIYDFANLRMRGQGVAMAQLVNVIGFAVKSLGHGDTLIIHGAERISETVQDYMEMQIDSLTQRGGRVVYLYNSVEKMIAGADFNGFVRADYTILGPMTADIVPEYQSRMNQSIPPDLQQLITTTGRNQSYLRRKFSNVVFYTDLGLGINAGQAPDSVGGTMPGRGRKKKAGTQQPSVAPQQPPQQPVASSAGAKMDEAVTEDGPARMAQAPAGERYNEEAGKDEAVIEKQAQQRVVGGYNGAGNEAVDVEDKSGRTQGINPVFDRSSDKGDSVVRQ